MRPSRACAHSGLCFAEKQPRIHSYSADPIGSGLSLSVQVIGKIQPQDDDHLAATWNIENTRQWREQERWAAKLPIDRCVAREHVFATFARAVVAGRKVSELRIQEERERAARARDVRVVRWGPPDHWNEFGPCTSLTSPGTTPSGMPIDERAA